MNHRCHVKHFFIIVISLGATLPVIFGMMPLLKGSRDIGSTVIRVPHNGSQVAPSHVVYHAAQQRKIQELSKTTDQEIQFDIKKKFETNPSVPGPKKKFLSTQIIKKTLSALALFCTTGDASIESKGLEILQDKLVDLMFDENDPDKAEWKEANKQLTKPIRMMASSLVTLGARSIISSFIKDHHTKYLNILLPEEGFGLSKDPFAVRLLTAGSNRKKGSPPTKIIDYCIDTIKMGNYTVKIATSITKLQAIAKGEKYDQESTLTQVKKIVENMSSAVCGIIRVASPENYKDLAAYKKLSKVEDFLSTQKMAILTALLDGALTSVHYKDIDPLKSTSKSVLVASLQTLAKTATKNNTPTFLKIILAGVAEVASVAVLSQP